MAEVVDLVNVDKLNAILSEHKNRFLLQHGLEADEYSKTFDFFVSILIRANEEIHQLQVKNKTIENELEVLRKEVNKSK